MRHSGFRPTPATDRRPEHVFVRGPRRTCIYHEHNYGQALPRVAPMINTTCGEPAARVSCQWSGRPSDGGGEGSRQGARRSHLCQSAKLRRVHPLRAQPPPSTPDLRGPSESSCLRGAHEAAEPGPISMHSPALSAATSSTLMGDEGRDSLRHRCHRQTLITLMTSLRKSQRSRWVSVCVCFQNQ